MSRKFFSPTLKLIRLSLLSSNMHMFPSISIIGAQTTISVFIQQLIVLANLLVFPNTVTIRV